MSSNPPTIRTVRGDVDAILKPLLPAEWRTVPSLDTVPTNFRRPLMFTEFTGMSIKAGGETVPAGFVFCEFDLIVAIPSTDNRKGEDSVDTAVASLIVALDAPNAPIQWDTAKKERLDSGQLCWRVSLAVLTTTRPTT